MYIYAQTTRCTRRNDVICSFGFVNYPIFVARAFGAHIKYTLKFSQKYIQKLQKLFLAAS